MTISQSQFRTYQVNDIVSFRRAKERYGGLSNMTGSFPLRVNGVLIHSSEALYQACRFPHLSEVQQLIVKEKSPMTAKMVSKPYLEQSRHDWLQIRVRVMRWVLRVKLATHWSKFGDLLLSTEDMPIVEDSRKDDFWGALRTNKKTLVGMNVLGRLLMELREEIKSSDGQSLRVVAAPPISDFLLLGKPIEQVGPYGDIPKESIDPDIVSDMGTLWGSHFHDIQTNIESTSNSLAQGMHNMKTSEVTNHYPKRLIEVDLPIARISAHARREKSIRHGHISTLHIWWARRPLAACRAVICAALWPDPASEGCPESFVEAARVAMVDWAQKYATKTSAESDKRIVKVQNDPTVLDDPLELRHALLDFIADFANWNNSTSQPYLKTSRKLTDAAHVALGGEAGTRPLVVDPFAGGGSIPLEALRVGADAFASDLNPVAVLLNKVVLEYIPKYGQRLADEVRKWGQWVKEQAEKELAEFYPKDPDGATPIAYLWARTILSEAPGQGAVPVEIPLLRSFWICKKPNRKVAIRWLRDKHSNVMTEIVSVTSSDGEKREVRRPLLEVFEPNKVSEVEDGTVSRGSATCPVTGFTTPVDSVRAQLGKRFGGTADARMYCKVVERVDGTTDYMIPDNNDTDLARSAADRVNQTFKIPEYEIPPDGALGFRVQKYGITLWKDLFTSRQQLHLLTLARLIRDIKVDTDNAEMAAIIQTLLGLTASKMASFSSSLCVWRNVRSCVAQTFGRQTLSMVWDFGEMNPFAESAGDFGEGIEYLLLFIEHIALSTSIVGTAQTADAAASPLGDDFSDVFFTDPPYYDAIPYSHLSEFFLLWLSSMDLVSVNQNETNSRRKRECIVDEGLGKNRKFYESTMQAALCEGRRVAKPDAVGVVVFAHKSTAGWESQIQAMLDSAWVITGSWPIDTERSGRLRAFESAALASSIHLVCRPRENPDGSLREEIGEWRDVLAELPGRIHEWMPRLAEEGVVGADAIFACLGPALEIFSRYSHVEKASGEPAKLREYLEHVWAAVSTEALTMIFHDADAAGLEPDARLTAMWLWTLGAGTGKAGGNGNGKPIIPGMAADEEESPGKTATSTGFTLEYDAARKIAQGLGINLEKNESIVEVKGDKARLLPVSERTQHLFGKGTEAATTQRRRKKEVQKTFFDDLDEVEAAEEGWGELKGPPPGSTVLDRLHQTMILFAAGRGELMKRFLTEEGVGSDARFWKLAQSLSALYPSGSEEKRWVDGVLARKKGLGL